MRFFFVCKKNMRVRPQQRHKLQRDCCTGLGHLENASDWNVFATVFRGVILCVCKGLASDLRTKGAQASRRKAAQGDGAGEERSRRLEGGLEGGLKRGLKGDLRGLKGDLKGDFRGLLQGEL